MDLWILISEFIFGLKISIFICIFYYIIVLIYHVQDKKGCWQHEPISAYSVYFGWFYSNAPYNTYSYNVFSY